MGKNNVIGKYLFNDLFLNDNKERSWGVSLSQYMYTPSDISIAELMEEDRPYGGWLYIGMLLMSIDNDEMDMMELDVGVTGPASLCNEVQTGVHKLIDSQTPYGWDNQINTELGINIIYQKRYRYRYSNYLDFIPHYGGSLGNIFTYVGVGGIVRAGYNLPDDFGILRMEPTTRNVEGFRCYVFADIHSRYVVRNIFLDGNTFEDSHRVDKESFVADGGVGVGIGYSNFEVIYAGNIRSKEFKGQEEVNSFGTIAFSVRY